MHPEAIHGHDVCFGYGRRSVLRGLECKVESGKTVALLGRNGAGKTTLLQLLAGQLRVRSGELRILGRHPVRERDELLQDVALVPDHPDVYPWMTVTELFRLLATRYQRWNETRVQELLAELEVPQRRPFRTLSKGEARKAMLIAAVAPEPRLLLLDEPFSGLDPIVREDVLRSIIEVMDAPERTVVVATHDLDVAARLAEEVFVLEEGRLARSTPVAASAKELRELLVGATQGADA